MRVNAIAPGAVKTERILAMIEVNPAAKKAIEIQPLGLIDPLEIAQLAVFLASDESRSITVRFPDQRRQVGIEWVGGWLLELTTKGGSSMSSSNTRTIARLS